MRAPPPPPLYKPSGAPVLGETDDTERFSLPDELVEFDDASPTERTTYDVPQVGPTAMTARYVPVQA